jgi:hypothetical protein
MNISATPQNNTWVVESQTLSFDYLPLDWFINLECSVNPTDISLYTFTDLDRGSESVTIILVFRLVPKLVNCFDDNLNENYEYPQTL